VDFKPKSGKKYCSHKCAVIQIGRDKKGQPIGGSLPAWHGCAKCHALMGMSGKMSGDLLRKDKATICQFRKENGLPTLSKSQAIKSLSVKSGKVRRDSSDQWWKDNWAGVVDTYWDKCSGIVIAKMKTPEISLSMLRYYSDLERSRKKSAEYARKRHHKYMDKKDSLYLIRIKLRNQIKRIYKKINRKKDCSTIIMLGCSINQAKIHIEKQFKKGMTWDNHGTVWEIDHIIPLAAFDLTRKDQQMIANHFTNLRPEWKTLNRLKSDKITITHQIAFA